MPAQCRLPIGHRRTLRPHQGLHGHGGFRRRRIHLRKMPKRDQANKVGCRRPVHLTQAHREGRLQGAQAFGRRPEATRYGRAAHPHPTGNTPPPVWCETVASACERSYTHRSLYGYIILAIRVLSNTPPL